MAMDDERKGRLFEGALSGNLMYSWGRLDACESRPPACLILNVQSQFDVDVSDVMGKTSRYFIIEMKRDFSGIAKEVAGGKPDRAALVAHLAVDPICRELSIRGHFAGFPNEDELAFMPYLYAVNFPAPAGAEWPIDLVGLYFYLHLTPEKIAAATASCENIPVSAGLTEDELATYIECMNEHYIDVLGGEFGEVIFGSVNYKELKAALLINPSEIVVEAVLDHLKSYGKSFGKFKERYIDDPDHDSPKPLKTMLGKFGKKS